MRKPLILGFLAGLLALLLAACGGGTSEEKAVETLMVEASDGSASLTVPLEAIPSGVDPSSITVTAFT